MGGKGSGRLKKTVELANCQQIMAAAALPAARYLRDVIVGTVKRPSWSRIECAKFLIDHFLGKPKQRTELTGAGGTPLTWEAVLLLAEKWEQEGERSKIVGVRLIGGQTEKSGGNGESGEAEPEDKGEESEGID
jgi:hypothetical protein